MHKSTGNSYRQPTQEERYQIKVFLEIKRSQTEMVTALHRSKSTISREIRRDSVDEKYHLAKQGCLLFCVEEVLKNTIKK